MTQPDSNLPTPSGGKWAGFVQWLKFEWHTPLAILGGIISPLSRLAPGGWGIAVLVTGVVLLGVAAIGAAVNKKRTSDLEDARKTHLSDLEDQVSAAESERDAALADLTVVAQVSKAVYRSLLTNIAAELGLGSRERISIYLHDPGLPSFQLLSRHSSDPSLEQAQGRKVYRDTEGIIGQAWREGFAEEPGNLPDPIVGGPDYAAENYKKYNLPTDVTDGLAMKSRALVALRYPAGGIGDTYIGVLVVESLSDLWDTTTVRSALDQSDWWFTLQEHLKARRHQLPVLSNAEGKGF